MRFITIKSPFGEHLALFPSTSFDSKFSRSEEERFVLDLLYPNQPDTAESEHFEL